MISEKREPKIMFVLKTKQKCGLGAKSNNNGTYIFFDRPIMARPKKLKLLQNALFLWKFLKSVRLRTGSVS